MLKDVTLEISLKPFKDLSPAAIRKVCQSAYDQWLPLFKEAGVTTIMFWSADGSELLDYKGNMQDEFEWDKYIGVANSCIYGAPPDLPLEQITIHHAPRIYTENPVKFTYADLKLINNTFRDIFKENNQQVKIGTTFDPGPEFAKSTFKYERHPEICMGETMAKGSFVCCYATLNVDKTSYAGFPNGIEQGTSFGTFLGRQTKIFCQDLDFDYIWFSNGFGFGLDTWGVCGAIFDGERFSNEECSNIQRRIFDFWSDFRRECPELPVKTRGTNLATGMDLASDSVPLREIYRNITDVAPPPNSPWAALNGDFGMELCGWMSHIAELPDGKGYPFRFYIHDPWFVNSPWLDRYFRSPHDIYLPMSVCRIDKNGAVQVPDTVNLLTLDDSYGNMPEQVPNEVIPYILEGLRDQPNAAGPIIWLYPFNEYHDMTFSGEGIEEVFFGDWFMRSAINCGFIINTVISTANFPTALDKRTITGSEIVITPTASVMDEAVFQQIKNFIYQGGKVLFYGPVNDRRLLDLLQLEQSAGVTGELEAEINGTHCLIKHNEVYSGGPITNILHKGTSNSIEIVASTGEYALATVMTFPKGGMAGWVRGSNSFTINKGGRYPQMLDRNRYFYPEELMRIILGKLGYSVKFVKFDQAQPDPVIIANRHNNALFVSNYAPNMNTNEHFSFPEGAPIFSGTETVVTGDSSVYHLPKAAHYECRVYVEMEEAGAIQLKDITVALPGFKRRMELNGLKNATVRFRPETGYEEKTSVLLNPKDPPYATGNFLSPKISDNYSGTVFEYKNVTGTILISWWDKK